MTRISTAEIHTSEEHRFFDRQSGYFYGFTLESVEETAISQSDEMSFIDAFRKKVGIQKETVVLNKDGQTGCLSTAVSLPAEEGMIRAKRMSCLNLYPGLEHLSSAIEYTCMAFNECKKHLFVCQDENAINESKWIQTQ